jgi:hypothetical protein
MHPGGLTAVNQISLDLAHHAADPVMQLHLDTGTGELAQVNHILILGRAAADLHLGRRPNPHSAALKVVTPRSRLQASRALSRVYVFTHEFYSAI